MRIRSSGPGSPASTAAWRCWRGRPRGHRGRPPAGGGLRDELCQRRPGGAGPRLRLGVAQRRADAAEVAVARRSAAALPLPADPAFWRWALEVPRAVHERAGAPPTRATSIACAATRQQALHGVSPMTGDRLWRRAARHPLSAPKPGETLDRGVANIEDPERRRASRSRWSTASASPRSTRHCAGDKDRFAGAIYARATRAAMPASSPGPRRAGCVRARRRASPRHQAITRHRGRGRPDRARASPTSGELAADLYVMALRQLQRPARPQRRRRSPGLPDQGLLGDAADRRRQPPADPVRRRRGQSLRLRATRRPRAR